MLQAKRTAGRPPGSIVMQVSARRTAVHGHPDFSRLPDFLLMCVCRCAPLYRLYSHILCIRTLAPPTSNQDNSPLLDPLSISSSVSSGIRFRLDRMDIEPLFNQCVEENQENNSLSAFDKQKQDQRNCKGP